MANEQSEHPEMAALHASGPRKGGVNAPPSVPRPEVRPPGQGTAGQPPPRDAWPPPPPRVVQSGDVTELHPGAADPDADRRALAERILVTIVRRDGPGNPSRQAADAVALADALEAELRNGVGDG